MWQEELLRLHRKTHLDDLMIHRKNLRLTAPGDLLESDASFRAPLQRLRGPKVSDEAQYERMQFLIHLCSHLLCSP